MFSFHPEVSKGKIHCLGPWLSVRSNFASPPREQLAKPGDVFLLITGRKGATGVLWVAARAGLHTAQCIEQPHV